METLRDDDLVGRQIGRYRIVRQISAGQTTDVYEAEALDLGRQVAFKALKPQEAINPRTLERFNQASAVQVRLSHPNIVPLIDFGRHEGVHFIVNRLMSASLADRMAAYGTQSFTPEQVSALLTPLADALDYAHGLGIIHGDLKPSHILFDEQDRPAWADFGLTSISRSANPGLTVTTAGAPAYMSPEQAMGESATPATDQYALGLIAYQLLTGRLPFEGDTPITILSKHINETPPAPHTLNPQISEALSAVILKVLAKKPEDRYPSVVTFAEAFGEALRSKPEPPLRPLTPAEIEQLERELPDLEMALRFPQNVKDVAKNISLSTQEWRVVGLINPRNSIAQIADTLHLTDLEIRRTVYALLQAGLVELVPARGGERAFPLEVEAPTLEEAILKGLEALDLEDRDQIDYEVLQEPRRGFLGAGARPAIINVWRKPERTVPAPSSTTVTNLINRIKNLGNEAPSPEVEVEVPTAPVEGTPKEEVPAVPVTPPRTSGANKMERFTQRARRVLSLAQEEAQIREHGVIHLEHLMLGLSREVGGVSGRVLLDLGVKEAPLRQMVDNLTVPPLKPTDKGPDLAENVKRSLEFAVDEARRMGHHYIGTEHLLLGLLRAEGADRILSTIQVTAEQIRKTLRQVLRESPPAQVSGEITTETPSTQSNQTKPPTSTKTRMERFTQRARRVLALAQEEAETGEHVVIAPEHLLVALRVEEGGVASRVLMNEGLELAPMRDLLRQTFSSAGQTPPKSPDLNPATRKSLELAVDEARKLGHHYIGTEHLLLGVMRQAEVQNFVERLGFNTDHIRTALLGVLGESPTAPGVANQPTSPAESAESNTGTAAEPRVNASTANDPNVNPNPSLLNQNAAPEPVRKSKRPAAPDQVDQELARQSKQAPTKRPQPADGESATPINVFISYSRKDESFRRTFDSLLNDQLAALGFQAQIGQDTALVAGTTQWGVTVDKTILECDLFVLLISPDSIQSEWCQRELDLARQHDRRILFVLIKPVELSPSLEALRLMWVEMTLEIPLPTMRESLRNALQDILIPTQTAPDQVVDSTPMVSDQIFLYGSSSDGAPHLQRLRRDLERNGVKVWNVSQIQATGTINEQIQRGIRESQAVVVVITPALSAPNAVNAELNLAVQLQKPIIPVQVMVAELPLILRTYQLIDMREPRYEVMLPRLIEAIQRVGAIPSPLSQSPQTEISPTAAPSPAPTAAPPSLLRLNTEVIYEMGAVYPVEIQLASAALEQSVVVRAKNIALIGETAFTIPPQHEGLMRLEARGVYPGGGEISAELYHNGVRVDSSAVAVEVILDPEMVKKPSALPLPEAAGTFARPADLTLRIQLIPLDSVGSVFRLNLSAWSGYDYLQLENTPLGYRDVPRKLIEHLWTRLQRAAANPAIREGEVRAVGRLLWREVLPPELDKLYREQIAPMRKGTRLSGVRTLLIWTESIPGLPPLPFELAIPHRQPLCELFQITRGIEGLGGAWRTEFPLGPVHVTHDPTLSAFTQTPLRWADEGGMSPPETTPSRGLESTHPAVGFHVVRADGALARQSRALTLAGENTDAWEAYLRDQAARLSLKAPLVTLSRLADSTGGSLDDGALALEFLRSGAVSVVSTWWSVSPALDRAFWGAFYRAVWEGETLGAAVHRGREAVRQVAPGSVDGFAFYALGDPLATGYLVVEGIGYLEVMLIDVGQNEERRP